MRGRQKSHCGRQNRHWCIKTVNGGGKSRMGRYARGIGASKHALRRQNMYWGVKTCIGASKHALGRQNMHWGATTCIGASKRNSGAKRGVAYQYSGDGYWWRKIKYWDTINGVGGDSQSCIDGDGDGRMHHQKFSINKSLIFFFCASREPF